MNRQIWEGNCLEDASLLGEANQGCRKLFRARGANRAKGASRPGCLRGIVDSRGESRAAGGIAGSGDESCKKGILRCAVIIIFG